MKKVRSVVSMVLLQITCFISQCLHWLCFVCLTDGFSSSGVNRTRVGDGGGGSHIKCADLCSFAPNFHDFMMTTMFRTQQKSDNMY